MSRTVAPPHWRVWTTDAAELERDVRRDIDVTTVLVPHCHGYVVLLDPTTATAYASLEFDTLTRVRSLCQAVEEFKRQPQRRRHLVVAAPAVDAVAPTDDELLADSG